MGVLDTIRKAFTRKEYKLGGKGGFQMVEMAAPPTWGYQQYLKAYGEIGWLYGTVNVIAQAVAKVPWHLYALDSDGERTEIFQHDALDLWQKPNPFQTRYQFTYLGTMYKLLVGDEFWQMNFNGKGQPGEMWLAPPSFMSVIPDPVKYISHYEYKRGMMEQAVKFTVEEIIHIKTPCPFNEYRGLSPAQALTIDLDSERYAAKYQQKLFFNDATPGFVLEYPAENLPPMEARKELMQEWDDRYRGFRNRGKTAFLFGAKANVLTMSNRDMDFSALRKYNRDAILGAYHVPRSIIGITEDVNRANAEAAQFTFAQYCVDPELSEMREAVNKELCPLFGDKLIFDYENPIPEDEAASTLKAKSLWESGIVTLNEARSIVGLETVDGPEGDEFKKPAPNPFESFGQPSKPDEPEGGKPENPKKPGGELPEGELEEDERPGGKKSFFRDDEADEYWKGYVKRVEAYEAPIIAKLGAVFKAQEREALEGLKLASSAAGDLVSQPEFQKAYSEAVAPILTKLVTESIGNGMALVAPKTPHKDAPPPVTAPSREPPPANPPTAVGAPAIPPTVSQAAINWLKTRIDWAANEIGEETAKLLANELAEGFKLGESMDDLAKRVRSVFDVSRMRSERIARTETMTAANHGAVEGYKATGWVDRTQWWAAIDERTCDICGELHKQVNALGEGYEPPAHVNCRCTLLPVLKGELPEGPETPGAFA